MEQKMSDTIYDVIIIGGGPGGLTAGIYAKRAAMSAVLIEKGAPGGQIINSDEVENYPGFEHISGAELGMKFSEHANSYGLEVVICFKNKYSARFEAFFDHGGHDTQVRGNSDFHAIVENGKASRVFCIVRDGKWRDGPGVDRKRVSTFKITNVGYFPQIGTG